MRIPFRLQSPIAIKENSAAQLETAQPPQVGLALGSGGARGWAHVGVLRALKQIGIEPQIICGSSMGALVGAAYACGTIEKLYHDAHKFRAMELLKLVDLVPGGGGFLQGNWVMKRLQPYIHDVQIESLPLTYGAITTSLNTGREVCRREGALRDAVRASISIPLLFEPAYDGEQWLLDGGLVNPVPVSWCRRIGAQAVIAVVVHIEQEQLAKAPLLSPMGETLQETAVHWLPMWLGRAGMLSAIIKRLLPRLFGDKTPGMIDILIRFMMIMHNEVTRLRLAQDPPELLLHVHVPTVSALEFHHAKDIIAAGEACVLENKEAIVQLWEKYAQTSGYTPP